MEKSLFFIFVIIVINTPIYAEGEKMGKDDFISNAISDVFDKVGKYTSGEKEIMSSKDEGMDEDTGYDRDALGRKVPSSTLRSGRALSNDGQL